MSLPWTVKVLELCHVSPPPNSVPPTSLPLTFFDILWLDVSPMQRIFFYEFPHPTLHFTEAILPSLKHSLSLTLQHFFPLAGTLVCPPQPTKPYINYNIGDAVPLTIAESTGDFTHLSSSYPRDAREAHLLVPELPQARLLGDTQVQALPLLAIQVTIFPNFGICIGLAYHHIVGDGRSIIHFLKSWASIFKSKGDLSRIDMSLEFNKSVIKDPEGILSTFLNQWWSWRSYYTSAKAPFESKYRATFVMARNDIERLKGWTSALCNKHKESQPLHLSTFVVTCAFIWICLVKSQDRATSSDSSTDDDKVHHFGFLADCRNRYGLCIPTTYFGNCLSPHFASVEKRELLGVEGVVVAAKAIGSIVGGLENRALKGAEKWMSEVREKFSAIGRLVSVAGSPKLGVYETDFGWGRPKKAEMVHIDAVTAISLAECRDEKGGIEVGVALSKVEMEAFISIFEQGLKVPC